MKKSDDGLGMQRPITRRDIVHGLGAIAVGALLPPSGRTGVAIDRSTAASYPPLRDGLRGNHAGSFEAMHHLARDAWQDWQAPESSVSEIFDLVVVGAGISGLCAAYFYKREHPDARILILDNHDDFGGHAKRNEFDVDGRRLIGYGGTQTMQKPSSYSPLVKDFLDDLGINVKAFKSAYDEDFYHRNGLTAGLHFGRAQWGTRQMVRFDLGCFDDYIPVAKSPLNAQEAVAAMPISTEAKKQLLALLTTDEDQMPEIEGDEKWDYLYNMSYRDFLRQHLGITELDVFNVLQDLAVDSGVGIDAINALSAMTYGGLPGWDASGLPALEASEPYIHHFPDGNASIARQLVRRMIPDVADGSSMEDLITAVFDYDQLDKASSKVRLRLNSTVVNVEQGGEASNNKIVNITYIREGKAHKAQAYGSVLACNNSAIPYLCPQLPEEQREALAFQVKTPILYTSVALRNWRAWKKIGIGAVMCPGSYHINATLDFPVSWGDYQFSTNPDQPVIVHMERFPHVSNQGLTARQQHRAGRHELLATSFEEIERNVRLQLNEMLVEGGFDATRDISGITVNRWAHGYAYWYNPLFDTIYDDDDDERYPHMIARKPFGRISIANADSAASAMTESAIEQGYRAAAELI